MAPSGRKESLLSLASHTLRAAQCPSAAGIARPLRLQARVLEQPTTERLLMARRGVLLLL